MQRGSFLAIQPIMSNKHHKKRFVPHLPISTQQREVLQEIPNVYLVGLMGAGKSSVGRILAQAFKRPFLDSDEEIVKRMGATIPTIFEFEGESGFRAREAKVIHELCQFKNLVMATGGGAVLQASNRADLSNNGYVVYLSSTPERLLVRTRYDKNRPLLQNDDPLTVLKNLYAVRHPLYLEAADVVIKTGAGQITQVAMAVVQALIAHHQSHQITQTQSPQAAQEKPNLGEIAHENP